MHSDDFSSRWCWWNHYLKNKWNSSLFSFAHSLGSNIVECFRFWISLLFTCYFWNNFMLCVLRTSCFPYKFSACHKEPKWKKWDQEICHQCFIHLSPFIHHSSLYKLILLLSIMNIIFLVHHSHISIPPTAFLVYFIYLT